MAVTLYRTYTVVVQNASTYDPDNTLELFLYEGKLEIKIDPNTNENAVFQYGTTDLAIQVVDQYGVAATALAADTTDRPGEYDFVDLDLDGTTAGDSGETLYSVVGRPKDDTNFDRALIIIENTDISDPNTKQLVKLSIGSTDSLASNMAFAGGTVTFTQYTADTTHAINSATKQYLKLTNLPSGITDLIEKVTVAPTYAKDYTGYYKRLVPRFNVYYGTSSTMTTIVWQSVPAYEADDGSWVIMLQGDEYNILREKAGAATDFSGSFDIGSFYAQFVVSVEVQVQTIHVRNFQNTPQTTIPTTNAPAEKVCIHNFIDGSGNRITGIGDFVYNGATDKPTYNLDVRGALGTRVRISTRTLLDAAPSSTNIGYDTTSSYIGFSSSAIVLKGSGSYKFTSSGGTVLVGTDVTGITTGPYPYIKATTTDVWLKGSANSYLTVDTSENIYGNVLVSAASLRMLSLTSGSQKIGYDIGGSVDNYFGSSASAMSIKLDSKLKFLATTTYMLIGHDTSTYPRISATSSLLRLEMSADEYAEFLAGTTPTISMYAKHSTKKLAFKAESGTGGSTSYTYVGYDSETAYYAKFFDTGIELNCSPTVKLLDASSSIVKLGTYTGNSAIPVLDLRATYANLKGTATTYIKVTSSDQIYAYVNSSGSKLAMSIDSTDAKFGYYVDNVATGVYFKALLDTATIMCGGKDMFRYTGSETRVGYYVGDSSGVYFKAITDSATITYQSRDVFKYHNNETLVGYDCSTYPRVSITNSQVAIYASADSSIIATSSKITFKAGAIVGGDDYKTIVGVAYGGTSIIGTFKIPYGSQLPTTPIWGAGTFSNPEFWGMTMVYRTGTSPAYKYWLYVNVIDYTGPVWKKVELI